MGAVEGSGLGFSCSTDIFVHAAGMRVRLWSGKMSIRYEIPFRRIWPNTFKSLPCRGWWGRMTVTFSGTSMWVVWRTVL